MLTWAMKPLLTGSNQNESTIFTRMGGSGPEVEVALNNGFRCGTAEGAKARFLNKIPVWRYHFAGTKLGQTAGATHGQDIPLVFGDGKAGLGKLLQTAWASFAKDPLHALDKLSWPRYNPEG
jgi:carboxylesterase type B